MGNDYVQGKARLFEKKKKCIHYSDASKIIEKFNVI